MKRSQHPSGFALVATLVLMALVVIVVVAYLGNTRTDRSTSSIYANRLRGKIIADSGLAAAIKLLNDNTRYGNYITSMPPQVPAPAPRRTELYRPGIGGGDLSVNPADYLRIDNAVGEILSSRATYGVAPAPAVDPRPPPVAIPLAGPSEVTDPGFTAANSYDFNQVVRLGTNSTGRLVNRDAQPAYGQWVHVRNSEEALVGRYAFYVEDESMKVNVDVAGNNIGPGASNLRINDLALPATAPAPSTQIEETDPAAALSASANRTMADTLLMSLGSSGNRLASRSSLALLNEWNTNFSDYAHLITVHSRDDNTTARGWQRLNLNKVVNDAELLGTAAAKTAAALRIANWIRDAWTGPTPLASLQDYQMFGEEQLRAQIAANIVDYIDTDSVPTDVGDIAPPGPAAAIPVIGIEKIPYLVAVEVIFEASNSDAVSSATLQMKILFRFLNLYESALDLAAEVGSIEIQGVPVIDKSPKIGPVFDVEATKYTINIANLTPVNGTGTMVPAGVDTVADSGARTFQTGWLDTQTVTFTASATKPTFQSGLLDVRVLGKNGERLDATSVALNSTPTSYDQSLSKDFLQDATAANGPKTIASINLRFGLVPPNTFIDFGDPRFRGRLVTERWRNLTTRTDYNVRVTDNIDKAEQNIRTWAVDYYDYFGNRPFAFLRNGQMLNPGELGNVSVAEYSWRTLYLQYPERPATSTSAGITTEINNRRTSASTDASLIDLFSVDSVQPRSGALNINTQQRFGTQQHPLAPLFLGLRVVSSGGAVSGAQPSLSQTIVDRLCNSPGDPAYSSIFDRRTAVGAPSDNTPLRPFFKVGDLASTISRLVNTSINNTTAITNPNPPPASITRTRVTYSALRTNPTTLSQGNANYQRDTGAEQIFREVSNSITTRGNVFRVLYVGQAIKDIDKDGNVDSPQEVQSEYLAEAFVERQAIFQVEGTAPDTHMKTSDSSYKLLATRVITE